MLGSTPLAAQAQISPEWDSEYCWTQSSPSGPAPAIVVFEKKKAPGIGVYDYTWSMYAKDPETGERGALLRAGDLAPTIDPDKWYYTEEDANGTVINGGLIEAQHESNKKWSWAQNQGGTASGELAL